MLFMVRQFSPHCMDFTREFIKTVAQAIEHIEHIERELV